MTTAIAGGVFDVDDVCQAFDDGDDGDDDDDDDDVSLHRPRCRFERKSS